MNRALSSILWTPVALVAFASNSLLCRLALGKALIDPGTFTVVRLLSGALTLGLLVALRAPSRRPPAGSWRSATALALYAAPFSFAYLHLSAGTGALILFGAVQITMIVGDLLRGRQPTAREWVGLFLAFGGLVYLTWPGAGAPDPVGALLMAIAGISWGVYSLRGKGAVDPLSLTAGNFVRGSVIVLPLLFFASDASSTQVPGVILAVVSGAAASGLGYAVWYRALRDIHATRAAIAQLLVPLLAALGGVAVLGESFTLRLFISGTIIALGVGCAIIGPSTSTLRAPDRAK